MDRSFPTKKLRYFYMQNVYQYMCLLNIDIEFAVKWTKSLHNRQLIDVSIGMSETNPLCGAMGINRSKQLILV